MARRDEQRDDRDRDRGKDKDKDDDRGRVRGSDKETATARREYGKMTTDLLEIYKHDQASARSRSGGGSKMDWISLQNGVNLVRLLPALNAGKPFYVFILQHNNVGGDGKGFAYCPKTFGKEEECPICEYVDLTVQNSKNKKEVADATEMKSRGRWLSQALDQDAKDGIPKLFGFPLTIYNPIMELLTGKYQDLLEFENGYDINIKREEGKNGVRYPAVYPERDPSPVDPDVVDHMLDLEEYVKRRIFTAEELTRVLDGDDPMDIVNARDGGGGGGKSDRSGRDRKTVEREEPKERDDRGREREEPKGRGDRERERDDRGHRDDRDRDKDRRDDRPSTSGDRERGHDRDDRGRDDRDDRGRDDRDDRGRDRDDRGRRDERDDDRGRDRDRDDRDDRDRGRGERDDRGRDDRGGRERERGGESDDRAQAEMDRLAKESGAGGRGRR